MLRMFRLAGLVLCAAAIATNASAAVITFDALPEGNNPNPLVLPGATFTTLGGFNFIAIRALCTSTSATSPANCSNDLEVEFDTPSSNLSFTFAANNERTVGANIGTVSLFSGVTLLGTVDIVVQDGDGGTFDLVNLAGFNGVTRLAISSTDFRGVLYDDFTFDPSRVPEPASMTLTVLGLGWAAVALRKRTT